MVIPATVAIVEEIAARAAPVPGDVDTKIADDMAELRSAPPALSNLDREFTQACLALVTADDGTVEPTIFGEATNDALDVAFVQRGRIADKKVLDREPILDRWFRHESSTSELSDRRDLMVRQ